MQNKAIDKVMLRPWPFRPKTRLNAAKAIKVEGYSYWDFETAVSIFTYEYVKLQTACRVAEDGIVSLDIESALRLSLADANDVVQRIFGEE